MSSVVMASKSSVSLAARKNFITVLSLLSSINILEYLMLSGMWESGLRSFLSM